MIAATIFARSVVVGARAAQADEPAAIASQAAVAHAPQISVLVVVGCKAGMRITSVQWAYVHRNDLRRDRLRALGYLRRVSDSIGFECSCCGDWHDEMPFAYHAAAPAPWSPEMEEEPGSVLGDEQCIIGGEVFFVRAIIRLAVLDAADEFEWGVWVSLSEPGFMRMNALWEREGRENEPPMSGLLSSHLPVYEPTTLGLDTTVHTQPVGLRPLVELEPTQHPLALEQRQGIMLERVQEFAERLIHGV